MYLVLLWLPGLDSATVASLLTAVLCKMERSGFLLASSAATVVDNGGVMAGSDADSNITGLAAEEVVEEVDSDLRRERCSTSFLRDSSLFPLSES